nr:arginine--tRNA ligase [Actinorhabdospora filicis]
MTRVLPSALAGSDPLVRRSEHADFQSNAAMSLAKKAGTNPRELAANLAAQIPGATVSGPGFINLGLAPDAVWRRAAELAADERLGVPRSRTGSRTVIDYSAPNVAKEMHVGHLRTTIIGDALVRVGEFLGAEMIRQNHLGDWGTQFGMLTQFIDEHPEVDWRHSGDVSVLDALYRRASALFKEDPDFAERARARVVVFQSGDEATLALWRELVEVSAEAFQKIYDRLGVRLEPGDIAGESFYNPRLDGVVAELLDKGVAVESDGAICVFFDDVLGPEGDPVPLIVRKTDGGYGYGATDLATIRYRVEELKADRLLYVIDVRQSLHLKMVWDTARRAGWLPADVEVVHVSFGTVLGPDGKPFKTRSGDTVRLAELLDAAVARAREVIAEREHDLGPAELEEVVQAAGIGAVKYADLSTSRTRDYVFDVERMVALQGNTAVYMQYALARVRSILRKLPAGATGEIDPALPLHEAEKDLVMRLDEFGAVLAEVDELHEPHRLCAYLYETAGAFSVFFERCPVLRAESDAVRASRVALVRLTGNVLARGLDLLGLRAPERM